MLENATVDGSSTQPVGQMGRTEHPLIHVTERFSYYSFPVLTANSGPDEQFITIDSNSDVYPTEQVGPQIRRELELAAAANALTWRRGFPVALLGDQRQLDALQRLRGGFFGDVPFRDQTHQQRLRVWCLLTYLFPIVPRFPFLRVRVPDISSARNMDRLLQRSCFNGLVVNDAAMKHQVRTHRRVLAGTVILSPEPRTGRHPGFGLKYLDRRPEGILFEPPVALVEIYGMGWSPQTHQDRFIDVDLTAPVPPINLDGDWHHLGCVLALLNRSAHVRDMLAHPEGPLEWLSSYMFGSRREQEAGHGGSSDSIDGQLAQHVESVWSDCIEETAGGRPSTCLQCNTLCLHERLRQKFPQLEQQLQQMGWRSKGFKRRLLEHGVIVRGVRNMSGCLSNERSLQWKGRGRNGILVPEHRLPEQ